MRDKRFVVSMSPHIRSGRTIAGQIRLIILALMPALAWGFYQFHIHAISLVVVGVLFAVITEAVVNRLSGRMVACGLLIAALIIFARRSSYCRSPG